MLDRSLDALCRHLDAEPMFHMSLGSKELFHSNFLAWLADRYPDLAAAVFGPWTKPSPGRDGQPTQREKHRLDLVVQLRDCAPLVIENKVFSLPDDDQLVRYANAIDPKAWPDAQLALLSFTKPDWPGDVFDASAHHWTYRSYAALRTSLLEHENTIPAIDTYEGETLRHYCSLVELIDELLQLVGRPADDHPLELQPPYASQLDTIGMLDAVDKARAHYLAARIRQRCDPSITVRADFTNKAPLIEGKRRLANASERDDCDRIGWQYQGRQFRLLVELGEKHVQTTEADRERTVSERYMEWFDFGIAELAIPEVCLERSRREASHRFNHYKPTRMVYRYCRPADKVNFTVHQLIELGVTYSEAAMNWRGRQ